MRSSFSSFALPAEVAASEQVCDAEVCEAEVWAVAFV
jgi:hypothetical protein